LIIDKLNKELEEAFSHLNVSKDGLNKTKFNAALEILGYYSTSVKTLKIGKNKSHIKSQDELILEAFYRLKDRDNKIS